MTPRLRFSFCTPHMHLMSHEPCLLFGFHHMIDIHNRRYALSLSGHLRCQTPQLVAPLRSQQGCIGPGVLLAMFTPLLQPGDVGEMNLLT